MALKYSTLFSLLLEIFQIAIQSYQHLSPSLLTSRIFILFFHMHLCMCVCMCAYSCGAVCGAWSSENNLQKPVLSCCCEMQKLSSGHQAWWQSSLSTESFCWPLLISNCIKPSYHDFLMDILNDRAQIRDREPSSGCSVSMY